MSGVRSLPSSLRRGLVGLAAVAILGVTIAVVVAEPAGGQAPPSFACNGDLYLTTGSPDDMTLTRVDQTSGALTPIGDGGLVANALGYNPADDHLYGMGRDDPHRIVRLGADGSEDDRGPAQGTPASWELTFVGTFLTNGHYFVLGDNASPPTPRGTVPGTWAEIDVLHSPPQVIRTVSHPSVGNNDLQDVAMNPLDGQLYAHSAVRQQIVRINRQTGAATPVGPVFDRPLNAGSSFFDSFGRMWLYGSGEAAGTQDTLYRIDDVTTDEPEVVEAGPTVTNSDGASCPFTVGIEKTVDPPAACAGDEVTYRYTVTNQTTDPPEFVPFVTATFIDDLPDDGRTFVEGSLETPFEGDVQPYGGTDRLVIEEMWLPRGEAMTLEVRVALPPDLPLGRVQNQAVLEDLPGALGTQVLSEFPGTPQAPDPTPLQVIPCADLGVDKSVDATVVGPDQDLTYAVRVTNHGPGSAVGVDSVADTLPPGLEFVAASDGGDVSIDGTIRWPGFDLAAGAHRDLTVTAHTTTDVRQLASEDGALHNTASIQHPGDPNPDNDRDTAAVPVDAPDIAVDKDDGLVLVAPGQETTYEIAVRNAGPGHADGVVVSDELPEMLEFVAGSDEAAYADPGIITWPAFDLAAGEERVLSVTAQVVEDATPGTRVRNVAIAPHPDDPNPEDNEDDDRNDVGDPPPPPPPDPERPPVDTDEPVPDDDPPLAWLPRTGFAGLTLAAIGVGLIALGSAAWWTGRPKPT